MCTSLHFRATGAYEAVQGLSGLFNIRSQNDDVQDFDVRWDQALSSASEVPTDMVLEGLKQVKIAGFCSASDGQVKIAGFYSASDGLGWTTELSKNEDFCQTSY